MADQENKKDDMVRISKVTNNKDRSQTWEIEYNEEFKKLYTKATGKKRATQKGMSNFVTDMLVNHANAVLK